MSSKWHSEGCVSDATLLAFKEILSFCKMGSESKVILTIIKTRRKQANEYTDGQVVTTLAAVAYVCMAFGGATGPAAVVLGGGLALSSTAVAMQVLQDRNEAGSRHGRAAFAVLLLQVNLYPSLNQFSTCTLEPQKGKEMEEDCDHAVHQIDTIESLCANQ